MLRQLSLKALGRHVRSHSTSTSSGTGKWNLVSSVCLQRKPILVKEMTELEKKMYELQLQIENENSWKSDWDLKQEKDMIDVDKVHAGTSKQVERKLCQDWEDEWKVEHANFPLEDRLTEADKKNDVTSWYRLLDQTLILLVQQKDSGNRWILPYGDRIEGETMRQAAERVLKESCGDGLQAKFYGNAPCGYFQFKYPKAIREKTGIQGNKVFFYKAYLSGGAPKSSPILKDFKWVSRHQLSSTLPPDYYQSVNKFVFDEN